MLPKVKIAYRKNLDEFLAWEKAESIRQEQILMGYRYKHGRRGFRVPDFVGVLAFLALIASLVWVFRRAILP